MKRVLLSEKEMKECCEYFPKCGLHVEDMRILMNKKLILEFDEIEDNFSGLPCISVKSNKMYEDRKWRFSWCNISFKEKLYVNEELYII